MSKRRSHGTGSVTHRGIDRWQIRIRLGFDPATRKERRRNFTVRGTKADAERALREALTKIDYGIDVTPEKITIGTWLVQWLTRLRAEARIGDSTEALYASLIRRYLVPAFGQVRLQDLRSDHLADLTQRLLAGDDPLTARPLSPSTIHQVLVIARQALAEAVRFGLIARNPADAVRAPSVRNRAEKRAMTEDEIRLVFSAAVDTSFDTPFRFTIATGVRLGELLALRWSDIDEQAGLVTIQRSLRQLPGRGLVFNPPKRPTSRRAIELSLPVIELLARHRRHQLERRLQLGPAWQDRGLVFPSGIGTPWSPRNFHRGCRRIIDESGIESPQTVDFHCLRHTAASQWIRHGADVFSVSRRLGHASAAFTMDVYAHLLHGQQRVAAEALDHLIAGA